MIEMVLPAHPPTMKIDLSKDKAMRLLLLAVFTRLDDDKDLDEEVLEVLVPPSHPKVLVRVRDGFDLAGMPQPDFRAMLERGGDTGIEGKKNHDLKLIIFKRNLMNFQV